MIVASLRLARVDLRLEIWELVYYGDVVCGIDLKKVIREL